MQDLKLSAMEKALESFAYADARVLKARTTSVSIKDGVVEAVSENASEGVSTRIFEKNTFGFACANKIAEFPSVVKQAAKLAKLGSGKTTIAEPEVHEKTLELKPSKNPLDFSIEEKIKLLLEIEKAAHVSKKVHSVQVSYRDSMLEKVFVNSLGSQIAAREPSTVCFVAVYAKQNNNIQWSSERTMLRSGLEALKDFEEKAKSAGKIAVALLSAKKAPAGKTTVVLDPKMAGILAHEAVGHASEADLVSVGASCFEGKLGQNIASEEVTIIDSPLACRKLWGSYEYDDEGTKAKETKVIERGVLKSYLTSLDSARFTNHLTGNARADWLNTPLVRMSNTFFAQGKASAREIFDVRKGIYVLDTRGGQVSTKQGTFMFSAGYSYLIENGEVQEKEMLRDFSISGNLLETLKKIDAVGKKLEFHPGYCGKSDQSMPITDGAPHLKIKNILVG